MSTDPIAPNAPHWQPTLRGEHVTLRPIRADDLDAMHTAANDPEIWAQHSERDRHERTVFEKFFHGALASGGGLVIIDNRDDRVIGSSRYYDWNEADKSVVIGYTYLERAHWGGATNREVKALMLAHAFQRARTIRFHVSPGNIRSQRALERIGARFEEQSMVMLFGIPSERMIYRLDRG